MVDAGVADREEEIKDIDCKGRTCSAHFARYIAIKKHMNNYNPNIHHRKSIRMKGYDYSQSGLYFITICVQDRKCLFGKIVVGVVNFKTLQSPNESLSSIGVENFQPRKEMILNDAGKIVNKYWLDIPKHFPNVVLHEHIVMPNHVHGIVELIKTDSFPIGSVVIVGVENFQPLRSQNGSESNNGVQNVEPKRNEFQKMIPHSIGSIIKGFKIGVTKWFRNNTDIENVWQRNYYEQIIRNEISYHKISEYIINNPKNWKEDNFNNE